ncbi:hypothetical protein [Microbacterium algeriense]|uniref:hypothetical protein n=1 Tax=Microbacterium algeriense TaxID=2615184 RepID=UPI003D7089AC
MARVPIANLKGPQGNQGPRGLPGVNAVPADEAVAEYLAAEDSETGQAFRDTLRTIRDRVDAAADFGVKPTNADNTAALQAALNAAVELGKPLDLPPGVIKSGTVQATGPVSIVGKGKGVTKIQHLGTGSAAIVAAGTVVVSAATVTANVAPGATSIVVNSTAGIVAGDLIILRDNYSYTSTDASYKSGEMLRVKSVAGTTINLHGAVVGSWAALDGVYSTANLPLISKINPLRGVTVSDLSLVGNPTLGTGAIRVDFCDKVALTNVDVEQFGGFGIGINNSRDVTVSGYTARDLTDDVANGLAGYAIYAKGACQNITVNGGSISRVRHGFTTMGDSYGMPHNVAISSVTLSETTAAALDTHAAGEGITFNDNPIMNCFQGITSRARKVVIQGNMIVGTYGSHVMTLAEENLRDYVIRNNTIWGSPGGSSAITARNPVIALTIEGNVIIDAGADGIMVNPGSSTVAIVRNTIRNVGRALANRYHIRAGNSGTVVPGVSGGWTIVDNLFLQGSGSAIRAIDLSTDGVTGAVVYGNKIAGTYAAGSLAGLILATGSIVQNNPWITQAPPAVTGSRGGNAAVDSLMTVLAERGIITNNTTA